MCYFNITPRVNQEMAYPRYVSICFVYFKLKFLRALSQKYNTHITISSVIHMHVCWLQYKWWDFFSFLASKQPTQLNNVRKAGERNNDGRILSCLWNAKGKWNNKVNYLRINKLCAKLIFKCLGLHCGCNKLLCNLSISI